MKYSLIVLLFVLGVCTITHQQDVTSVCPAKDIPPVATAPNLVLQNLAAPVDSEGNIRPGFYHDIVVLHRIATNTTVHHVHNTSVLRVKNTNPTTAITITALEVSQPTMFAISGVTLPATIQPSSSLDITITFVEEQGDKGSRFATLNIKSDDTVTPSIVVKLNGLFMKAPEGGHEIQAQQVVNAFGWGINLGYGYWQYGIELPTSPILADETPSKYWRIANPAKPIRSITAGAFSGCCTGSVNIHLTPRGTNQLLCNYQQDPVSAQTILPRLQGSTTKYAEAECTANGTFFIAISYDYRTSGSPAGFIGVHSFPVRDPNGAIVPDTYLFVQDFTLQTGCGPNPGQANCDFNDNMVIFSNIKPADDISLDRSNTLPLGSKSLTLNFDQTYSTNVKDVNGAATGFTSYYLNHNDLTSTPGSNSFQAPLVRLDTAAKTLTITTAPGTAEGKNSTLVNGLTVNFDGNAVPFFISSKLVTSTLDATKSAGIMFGSDQDNFVSVKATGGAIQMTAEFNGVPTKLGTATVDLAAASHLELIILASPTSHIVRGGYIIYNNGVAQPVQTLSPDWTATGGKEGRYFSLTSTAGIFASHPVGGNPSLVSFSSFYVMGCTENTTLPDDVYTQPYTSQSDQTFTPEDTQFTSVPTGTDVNPDTSGPVQPTSDSSSSQDESTTGAATTGVTTTSSPTTGQTTIQDELEESSAVTLKRVSSLFIFFVVCFFL